MSLDSSETPSKAQKSENGNVSPNMKSDAEVKICSDESENSWSYIMAHHTKVNNIISKLEQHFTVFIHTSTVFFKEKGKVKSLEKPTISGLVFIQGKLSKIHSFLNENCPGIFLVKDQSKTAGKNTGFGNAKIYEYIPFISQQNKNNVQTIGLLFHRSRNGRDNIRNTVRSERIYCESFARQMSDNLIGRNNRSYR